MRTKELETTENRSEATGRTIEQIRFELNQELDKAQSLGFDTNHEARCAIISHQDWAERWDCLYEDCRDLVRLGNELRFVRGAK